MATVDVRLDVALDGVDVSAAVGRELATLDDLAAVVAGGTPDAAAVLTRLVEEVAPPDLPVVGDVLDAVAAAVAALPDDLPAAGIATVLDGLATAVGTQLTGVVAPVVRAGEALVALADADLVCATAPAPGTTDPGGTTGGEETEDGGAPPPRGAATAAAVTGALDGVLATLPDPLDLPGLLSWALERVEVPFRLPAPLPFVADFAEPLATVVSLAGADAATLRAHVAGTLTSIGDLVATIPGVVEQARARLDAAAAAVPADAGTLAGDVAARLDDLAGAVAAADSVAAQSAVDALGGLADTLDSRSTSLRTAVLADAPALVAAVSTLPQALDDRAALVAQTLAPADLGGPLLTSLREALVSDATSDAIAAAVAEIDRYAAWLQDLLRVLDVSVLTAPLEQAGAAVSDAVSAVQEVLADIGAGVSAALLAVAAPLETIDPAAVAAAARTELERFLSDLAARIAAAFAPVEEALADVADRVTEAAGEFDPASLTAVVEEAVEAVAGVLEDPAVTAAVDAVADALEAATAQLAAVEFTPVTDAAVAAIEEVDDLLAGLDTAALPAPATLALQGAVAVLPADLRPLTDELLDELRDLVAAGPVDLLERVRAVPAELRARIEGFDPATLIDDQLGPVFDTVLGGLDAFHPAAVLAEVEQPLAALPRQLADALDVRGLLAPLDAPVAQLRATLAAVDPAALAAPLTDGLAGLATSIRDQLGVDALAAVIGGVHARITDTVAMLALVRDAAAGIVARLDQLAALDADVEGWLDALFTAPVTDDGTVATAAQTVAAGVAASRQAQLLPAAAAAGAALTAALESLAPGRRLTAVVAAHRAVARADLAALPDPLRTAVVAVLDRLDPFDGPLARDLQALDALADDLAAAATATGAALADWDARHLAPAAPLVRATTFDADPAALLVALREAARTTVGEPLHALLGVAGPAGEIIAGLLGPVQALLTDVEARIDSLATVTGALDSVSGVVDEALDALARPDLGVLTDALDGVLDRTAAALAAVTPAALAEAVAAALDEVLDGFDPSALLPSVAALTAAFDDAVAGLAALDPAVVLGDAVGDAFHERVTPLLDRLDVSPLLDAAADRLAALPTELADELERVNEAYQRLRQRVGGLDLTVSIDVAIPSPF